MDSNKFQFFVRDWINTWNSHDLNMILSLYADNYVMTTPLLQTIAGYQKGTLRGRSEAERYWRKVLIKQPDLHFKVVDAMLGATDYVIVYMDNTGMCYSETFAFDKAGKIVRSAIHYAIALLASENRAPRITLNDPHVYFTARRAKPVFDSTEYHKIDHFQKNKLLSKFHMSPLPDSFSESGSIERLAEICLKEDLDASKLLEQVINDDDLDDRFRDVFEQYGMDYLISPLPRTAS